MNMLDLVRDFGRAPEPWVEGRTIPWDDAGFSARMLKEHLSQAHDGASRRYELIDRHVEFITRRALSGGPSRVLDLGCGPGFYCHRLAAVGHECVGIDFGPAAIDYARAEAERGKLDCRFVLDDIRRADFGSGYQLIMLLYGELNLFPRDEAVALLRRCAAALAPGGTLLLEVHSEAAVTSRGKAAPKWSAVESGLFLDRPHLRLEESIWLEESRCAAGRYWVAEAQTSEVNRYGWTMQAYDNEGYAALLAEAGLKLIETVPNLTGSGEADDFPVLVTRSAD